MINKDYDELFHGSPLLGLTELKPNKAQNDSIVESEPVVFATDDIEYAIFMALIGKNGWGGWDQTRFSGKGFFLQQQYVRYLSPRLYDVTGEVYVVDGKDFGESIKGEFRSQNTVKVIGSYILSALDIPSHITITK